MTHIKFPGTPIISFVAGIFPWICNSFDSLEISYLLPAKSRKVPCFPQFLATHYKNPNSGFEFRGSQVIDLAVIASPALVPSNWSVNSPSSTDIDSLGRFKNQNKVSMCC
jgi:hypothetical protein